MTLYKQESGGFTGSKPPLQRGEKFVKIQRNGLVYYEKGKMTPAEIKAAEQEAITRAASRKQQDQQSIADQQKRDREARRLRDNPPPPPPAKFIPGETRGIDYMRARLAETFKPATDLFKGTAEVTARLGPKIPGTDANQVSASGEVGNADLEGDSVEVGAYELTRTGVVKRGVNISTGESNLGEVSLDVEVGVDVIESGKQAANRAVEGLVEGPLGQRAINYGQLDRVQTAVDKIVKPPGG